MSHALRAHSTCSSAAQPWHHVGPTYSEPIDGIERRAIYLPSEESVTSSPYKANADVPHTDSTAPGFRDQATHGRSAGTDVAR